MTHISAQRSYFSRFEASRDLSLSRRSESRTGGLEPDGRKCKWIGRGVDRGDHGSVKRRKEKGASRCAHAGPKKKTVFGRVRRKWNGLRENERAPACIWAPLNQWPSYENRSLFTVSLREPPTWSTLATLASFLDDICICVSPLQSGILHASWTRFSPILSSSNKDDWSMNRDRQCRQFFFLLLFFSDYFFFFFGSITSKSINWILFYWLI